MKLKKRILNKTRIKTALKKEKFKFSHVYYEHFHYWEDDEIRQDDSLGYELCPPRRKVGKSLRGLREYKIWTSVHYKEHYIRFVFNEKTQHIRIDISEPAIDFDKWSNSLLRSFNVPAEDFQTVHGICKHLRSFKNYVDISSTQAT
jgi:hypothetical protein